MGILIIGYPRLELKELMLQKLSLRDSVSQAGGSGVEGSFMQLVVPNVQTSLRPHRLKTITHLC